eukprot:m.75164 g.75164  ORF g.75164 m.75164 type:complete len:925 (-) comp14470_c2_seq4:94-2868(-)
MAAAVGAACSVLRGLQASSTLATLATRHAARRGMAIKGNGIVGVRRETKNRWERRAPLTPKNVKTLVRHDLKVLVQPSNMRIFTDDMYEQAGAIVTEDISEASLIVGVKEVPLNQIVPDRTYMCFSHTIKAQEYNMPLLDAMVTNNVRLIDYERMLDENGKRVIGFGRFAGCAGMIDLLRGLGDRLLGLGCTNPFLAMGYTDYYHSLSAAKTAVQLVGSNMLIAGAPHDFAPIIVAFTGRGKVTQGALEIFEELPHEYITVADLPIVAKSGDTKTVYGVKLQKKDLAAHRDPAVAAKGFDPTHYSQHPEEYLPVFHEKVAPYITALLNGMYWDNQFPRLLTRDQMKELYHTGGRLTAIADVSADPFGSIEFTEELTTISNPFLVYNPDTGESKYDWEAEGVLLGSVDNLPAELPLEASNLFGEMLTPYIPELAWSDPTKDVPEQLDIAPTLRDAIICNNGTLAPSYEYISELRSQHASDNGRRVLMIGSGLVSAPVVHRLTTSNANASVTVASADYDAALGLASSYAKTSAVKLDVNDQEQLASLVQEHDIVISLVPYTFHAQIADACIASGTNLVTASYISDDMQARHAAAKEAGVTVMNEIGLDPGIDHLAAVTMIDDAQREGAVVESFVSWCGGLPSPFDSTCPLAYKFSWSPKGVLLAGLNSARFLRDGKIHEIKPGRLFHDGVEDVAIVPGLALEGVPNRDSMPYKDIYKLDDATTFFRGTLRYKGFGEVMAAVQDLGLLNAETKANDGDTWQSVVASAANKDIEGFLLQTGRSPSQTKRILHEFTGLGLLSDAPIAAGVPLIDGLSKILLDRLAYKKNERDLVLLAHELVVRLPDGTKEKRAATLMQVGEPFPQGPSAMALTVGLPTALAVEAILDGTVAETGVLRPTDVQLSRRLLSQLEEAGIRFVETTTPIQPDT